MMPDPGSSASASATHAYRSSGDSRGTTASRSDADDPLGARQEGGDLAPYAAAFARMTADRGQVQAVAELGGQVVGTLQLSIIPSLTRRGTTRAQIEGVRTLSTLRGKGIGEALFAWALDEARRRGAGLVQLTSDTSRGNAHRFY